jgi:DNA-binding SARP family transcriptional activator
VSRPPGDNAPRGDNADIRLLGELEVRHGGRPQPLPASKKTRALLGYLVATGRPHLREHLCTLLWEGPDDPRAALRWSLTKIRPLLDAGGGRLDADRERVAVVAAPAVAVDLIAVRTLLAQGVEAATTEALQDALARFRGELLEGLDLPACYRFHEWWVGERELLRALRLAALATLVARLAAAARDDGALEEALRWARQRVAIDPLTEATHVDVVRVLGRLGRVREAQAQVETCRRILDTELGARPSQALEQARRDLTAPAAPMPVGAAPMPDDAAPATAQASAPLRDAAAQQPRRPPLVGRDAPRAAIEAAVAGAGAGRGGPLLLFVGDPGIGKTRLLDLVADEGRAAGGTVVRGRAFEAEMVRPYGPWLDALRATMPPPGLDLGLLAPLLSPGEAGTAVAAVDAAGRPRDRMADEPTDRAHLFDAFARLLSTWSDRVGLLVLVLDDVQWLDEASAALVHFIARAALNGRVLIACAARAGELGDNAATLRVVRALDRERRLVQHHLEPLGPAETAALVRAIHPALDAQEAFASSEGNPLFALEIARAAASGAERRDDSLEGLLDERIARLDEPARDLLPWAAALGRSFDPEVLARVSGVGVAPLLGALDHLERHGVVRPAAGGYDFTHDLLRRAAYRRLSEPRRRLVHLQIARGLQDARGDDDAFAGEIAHHAALGGDALVAAEASVVAGRRCLRLFAFTEAAALASRGLQHLPRIEKRARIRLQMGLYAVLVDSGQALRRIPTFEADLTRAINDAQDAGQHTEAAGGFQLRSALHFSTENFTSARESSLRALEEIAGTSAFDRARQLAYSARCLMLLEHEIPRAQALADEAHALVGRRAGEISNIAWAQGLLGRYRGDDGPAAAAALAAAADGFGREESHWDRCLALAQGVMLQLERGDAAAATALCAPLAQVAAQVTERPRAASAPWRTRWRRWRRARPSMREDLPPPPTRSTAPSPSCAT